MARLLVLDWDYQRLHVVSATIKHGEVRMHQAVTWNEGQGPNPADAEALGRRLRDRLRAAGIAPAPVFACVGRDRVILKQIGYPPVPAAEEASVVRFQVIKELNEPAEEVVIDYTPTEESGSNGERRALAVILRREWLATYQKLCRTAGLKLAALTPRSFGTVACLHYQVVNQMVRPAGLAPDAAFGVLTLGNPWAEFCVMRGGALLFARSLAAGPTLAGEVRRNLAVYSGQAPQAPLCALFVADSGKHAGVRQGVQEMVEVPVYPFDPFAGVAFTRPSATGQALPSAPEAHGGFAPAIGLLRAQAERRALPINFVRPKEPRPARDLGKRRIAWAAAAAAVVILAGIGFCYAQLDARDRQLDDLFVQRTDLERQLSQFQEEGARLKTLDAWTGKDIVWLDELYDLTYRFPDTDTIRLTLLDAKPLERNAKAKHVARMNLKGMTTSDSRSVDQLIARLARDSHYRVEPNSPGKNTGADRFRFPLQFRTRLDIEKLPPEKYLLRLPETPDSNDAGEQPNLEGGFDLDAGGFRGGRPGGFRGGQPGGFRGGQP